MPTTEPPTTRGEPRDVEPSAYSGWLLRAFPESSQPRITLRAVLASAAILGVEYLVEVVWLDLTYWRSYDSFLADPGVQLSALGLVFTLMLLGQWGARYVELWATVRPAFDVPDERYEAVVRRDLHALYGRDHVPFVLFAGFHAGVYALFRDALPAGYLHIGFLHFFAVTALYYFYRHTVTIRRVTDLDLVDIPRARAVLSAVADFSVVVCLNWFAALAFLLAYVRFFLDGGLDGLESVALDAFAGDVASFYTLVGVFLVVVGILLFAVPVVLLHEALAAEKRERLRSIDAEYEALFEAWRDGDLDRDPSVGLELLDARRQNVEARSTWPYRLVSVGQILVGSVVPTALAVARELGFGG